MDRTDRQINHQIRMKMELITVLQERIKSMRNSGYGKKNAEEILSCNQKIEKETNDVRELKKLLSNERNVGVNVDVIDSKKSNDRQVSGLVSRQIDMKLQSIRLLQDRIKLLRSHGNEKKMLRKYYRVISK